MGRLAAGFPAALERAGVGVEGDAVLRLAGSLDRTNRDPASPDYGRQGLLDESLLHPQGDTPGGDARGDRDEKNRARPVFAGDADARPLPRPRGDPDAAPLRRPDAAQGVRRVDPPELALAALGKVGRTRGRLPHNPFPRLDLHEAALDLLVHRGARAPERGHGEPVLFQTLGVTARFAPRRRA